MLALLLLLPGAGYGGPEIALPPRPPNVFIIAIGINTYQNTPLKYARADAISIAEAIEKVYPETRIHKHIFLDEQATRHSIAAAFEEVIAASKPGDIFVFHFSGYESFDKRAGSEEEFYLLLSNADVRVSSPKILSSKGISANLLKSWTTRIQAGRQLFFFDTCNAEKVVSVFKNAVNAEGPQALELSGRQIMILSPEGITFEEPTLGHGWFTFTVLKGLTGDADVWPKDGLITAGELELYLRGQALETNAARRNRHKQRIASAAIGQDFEIVRLPGYRGVQVAAEEKQTPKPSPGKDYALLIATDSYDSWGALPNPVNDAKAIKRDLEEIYGFQTKLIDNPTVAGVYKELKDYIGKNFSPSDQLLIFIAGHGTYFGPTREGFLIAKDSKRSQDDEFGTTFVPLTRLRDIVDRIPAEHVFLIIDSWFGGTFDQRIADSGHRGDGEYAEVSPLEFKARKIKYKSRRYLTSGGKEYVPDGRPGQHSPFARKILEAMRSHGGKEGYLTVGKILQYVEKVTPEPRAGEFGNHEPGGDFVLIKK